MKTLDEVIKACEETVSDVDRGVDIEGCFLGATETRDALHYLKMYRSDQIEWDANRKAWDLVEEELVSSRMKYIAKLKELDIGTLNNPLTWEELKSMEGKPVWVEALLYKQWAVIAYVGDEHLRFEGVNLYAPESRAYMGADDGWQAYRKERS